MPHTNHPLTVAEVISAELRGINWSQQALDRVMENIHLAARDLPDTTEYVILRRQIARLQARLREAHGKLNAVIEAAGAAKLTALDSAPLYVTDQRLLVRREKSRNGADQVRRTRQDREEREATFAQRQREAREIERQAWLALREKERKEREGGDTK